MPSSLSVANHQPFMFSIRVNHADEYGSNESIVTILLKMHLISCRHWWPTHRTFHKKIFVSPIHKTRSLIVLNRLRDADFEPFRIKRKFFCLLSYENRVCDGTSINQRTGTPGARFRPGVLLEFKPKNCALGLIVEKK